MYLRVDGPRLLKYEKKAGKIFDTVFINHILPTVARQKALRETVSQSLFVIVDRFNGERRLK